MALRILSFLKHRVAGKPKVSPAAQMLLRAQVLLRGGQLSEAAAIYQSICDVDPGNCESMSALAAIASQSGELQRAVQLYDALMIRLGDSAETHYKRGNALNRLRRWEEALADYDRVIELDPGYANAFCNRGAVLEKLQRLDEALASFDRAVELNPGDVLAYYNRGSVLKAQQRLDEALASYDQAIALRSDYAEAFINRGHVLNELQRYAEAVSSYDKAIELNPTFAEAFQGRGLSLARLRRFEAALSSYDRAIEINPTYVEALQGRGASLASLDRLEAAVDSYNQALALNASQRFLLGLRRHIQMQLCDWDGMAADLQRLTEGVRALEPVCPPFQLLSLVDSAPVHRLAAEIWARENCPPDDTLGELPPRRVGERIRIGYFSADFRNHAVSFLTAKLFELHDRSKFEVIAFAFGRKENDPMRARLQRAFDRFFDVHDRSDIEVASLAREMGIDIAVDLGGYTEECRTRIFALRAAPVQVSYLGYLGTMAAPYMDYLVSDRTIIPEYAQAHYAEKIIYLPSYQANDSQRHIAERTFSREELGLPQHGFVFCCFNANYKIMPATFGMWMRILRRVEGSTLFLNADNPVARRNLLKHVEEYGADPSRVVFGERIPVEHYLARFRAMDLFLDTLPYNAGTTASDALWAGLPVLTCTGEAFAGRVAASLLNAIGLPELITATQAQYEELAVHLATKPALMAAIRKKLTNNKAVAPLFDTPRFTKNLESAYTQIYAGHRAGLPAEHVLVTEQP